MRTDSIIEQRTGVLEGFPIDLQPGMVLRAQGIDPAKLGTRQPPLLDLARRALAEGNSLIYPKAAFRQWRVAKALSEGLLLESGVKFGAAEIAPKLAGAEFIVAAVATIGGELERAIEKMHSRELLYQLALDGFGTAALGQLTATLTRHVRGMAQELALTSSGPIHPGAGEWELSAGQAQIFSLVNAGAVGVSLNTSFLMIPRKSVSMLYAIGREIRAANSACDECNASPHCQHKPAVG